MRERVGLALAIALVSAAALAYQLLLMRLLAIVHWYPFAALIVSLALLGHGVSGTVLSLAGRRAVAAFERLFTASALGFGIAAVAALALAQRVPFNGLELVWDASQVLKLAAIYLLLSVPFFFAACCFGLAFVARAERIPSLYGADLAGAGAGALLAMLALQALSLPQALLAVALGGPLAAACALLAVRGPVPAGSLLLAAVAAAALVPAGWLAPRVNEYKGLALALRIEGTRVVSTRSGPLGEIAVVESPVVPLRYAPGVSLNAVAEPPPQLGVFVDGDGMSVVTQRGASLEHFAALTSALPYALLEAPRVLVLGAGVGADVLQALTLGARQVVAVEPDRNRIEVVRTDHADFAGHLYADSRVEVVLAEPRAVLGRASRGFDLVVLPLSDSSVGASAGTQAASDQFLYTIEALEAAYARLSPGGLIAATRWETQPPRASLKLFATAIAALGRAGVRDPGAQLALIRGWQTSTLVVKRGALTRADLEAIDRFRERWSFDAAWLPGLAAADANRHHLVERDELHAGARALLSSGAAAYLDAYKFDLAPATDARPFFHDFFRWRALPELVRLREHGAAALLDSGYLVVVAGLVQAVPIAFALIVLPLLASRRTGAAPTGRGRTLVHFTALGLGFLFVEIALMSRTALYIGQPLLATATVLAALLVSAGLGSAYAARWTRSGRAAMAAALACAVLIAGYAFAARWFVETGTGWSAYLRAGAAALALAPLGFVMGMPFPLGLARLAATVPARVPWAWGINGCASVLSALLAVLLALEAGYDVVMYAAAALYLIAARSGPR
ncbi:MAG TPA: SAM-dependent methyltransferase [Candidatus Saccharimonadia bacterium]|nr:SAM-dependent methyltransferase [Candidatus Saccharimonadia bacterium]